MLPHSMRLAVRPLSRPYATLAKCYSTKPVPPVRPYRSLTEEERAAPRRPEQEEEEAPPALQSKTIRLLNRMLNPFYEPEQRKPTEAAPTAQEAPDPERGAAATQRVVREGVLDPRYKSHARRWIAVIIGSVVAIGLTPEVWRRTMKGEKRKEVPKPKAKVEGVNEDENKHGKSEP